MNRDEYQHPTIAASYSRETAEGHLVSVFDVGNGRAVQVTHNHMTEMYICEVYIIPQFVGASIYNSAKANIPTYEVDSHDGVTAYIDYIAAKYMMEVTSAADLGKEFL